MQMILICFSIGVQKAPGISLSKYGDVHSCDNYLDGGQTGSKSFKMKSCFMKVLF